MLAHQVNALLVVAVTVLLLFILLLFYQAILIYSEATIGAVICLIELILTEWMKILPKKSFLELLGHLLVSMLTTCVGACWATNWRACHLCGGMLGHQLEGMSPVWGHAGPPTGGQVTFVGACWATFWRACHLCGGMLGHILD